MEYIVEYTNLNTGEVIEIDVVTAPEDYTAEQYVSDCMETASPEWCEMLLSGYVQLIPANHQQISSMMQKSF